MSQDKEDLVRYQIRVPEALYQEIEAIAIGKGAKLHPRTKRPQLSETIVELLQLALERYEPAEGRELQSEKTPDLELIESAIIAAQTQQSQQFNQQFNSLIESQRQTQAELNRLYSLYHRLCDRLKIEEETPAKMSVSPASPRQLMRPLESYSAGSSMVNRQWLSLNGCFDDEAFNGWNPGEVRQDRRGNFWRRVDPADSDDDFKIPSGLAASQVFYVLAESKNSIRG